MKEIIEFVKHGRNRQRIGVLMARRYEDRVLFGWSRANVNHGDAFDQDRALAIAVRRMGLSHPIPPSLVPHVMSFRARAARYFKDVPNLFTFEVRPAPKMPKRDPRPMRAHKPLEAWLNEQRQR